MIASEVLVLRGMEDAPRARASARAAFTSLGLAGAALERAIEGAAAVAAAMLTRHASVIFAVGVSSEDPPRPAACVRVRAVPGAETVDAASLRDLADEVDDCEMPDGRMKMVLCWEAPPGLVRPNLSDDTVAVTLHALDEMERAWRRDHRARKAMEDLLGIVAHGLRNPIGSMASAAELLQLVPREEATVDAAAGILSRSARSALRLIADLEQLHRLDSGLLHIEKQEVRSSALADAAIEVARPQAQRRNVALDFAKDASGPVLMADADRIVQALGNLVVTAVDQSPEGDRVKVTLREEDGAAVFEVTDNGPHVPEDMLPSLFDRYRKHGPRRRGGAGLSLAIARELIEAHGGRVTCESAPGEPTRIRVVLPGRGSA